MSDRIQRVAESIKEEVGRMLERGEIKDPRIGFVTFTDAEVSKDLRHATIYFSSLGTEENKRDAGAGLNSAKGYIRSELGKRLRLKNVPEIDFKFDASVEASARISKLIHDLHKKDGPKIEQQDDKEDR